MDNNPRCFNIPGILIYYIILYHIYWTQLMTFNPRFTMFFQVVQALDVPEAVDYLQKHRLPSLILLDATGPRQKSGGLEGDSGFDMG